MRDRRGQSLPELLSRQICQMIIDCQIKSGDPLPSEHRLTAEFSVGRSTLREAIIRLRALNIVDVRHGHGTFVSNVTAALLHTRPRHVSPVEASSDCRIMPPATLGTLTRDLTAIRMQLDALGHEDVASLLKAAEDEMGRLIPLQQNGSS